MLPEYQRTRVKFCGMTSLSDIKTAVSLGVDAIGFIFYDKSKRFITPEKASSIIKNIPPFVTVIAVVVDPMQNLIEDIKSMGVHLIQYHGNESPLFCDEMGIPYIKAIPAKTTAFIETQVKCYPNAKAILLDTPSNAFGGTGLTFDWHMISDVLIHADMPLILSGGLSHTNVGEAINKIKPFGVDVCSSIEDNYGKKSPDKMTLFMNAVRGVCHV